MLIIIHANCGENKKISYLTPMLDSIADATRKKPVNSEISSIKPGLSATTDIVVGTRDTAHHVGSGKIKVLATPIMVMLMEEAALTAIEGLLPDGYQSVGTRLDINHVAATPVGMRVTATAEVISVDRRKVTFKVRADDEHEQIGEGQHDRVIVELQKFDAKISEKAGQQ